MDNCDAINLPRNLLKTSKRMPLSQSESFESGETSCRTHENTLNRVNLTETTLNMEQPSNTIPVGDVSQQEVTSTCISECDMVSKQELRQSSENIELKNNASLPKGKSVKRINAIQTFRSRIFGIMKRMQNGHTNVRGERHQEDTCVNGEKIEKEDSAVKTESKKTLQNEIQADRKLKDLNVDTLRARLLPSVRETVRTQTKAWLKESLLEENFDREDFTESCLKELWREKHIELPLPLSSDNLESHVIEEVLKDLPAYLNLTVDYFAVQLEQYFQLNSSSMPEDNPKPTFVEGELLATKHDKGGCRRLPELAVEEKKIKFQQQEILASQCLHHLPNFLREQVEYIVASYQPICPELLGQLLKSLQQEMVLLCRDVLTVEEVATRTIPKLIVAIQEESDRIRRDYTEMLQVNQVKTVSIIESFKSQYDAGMNAFIKCGSSFENGLVEEAYDKEHIRLKEQLLARFVEEIAFEVERGEPLLKHVQALLDEIEMSRKSIFGQTDKILQGKSEDCQEWDILDVEIIGPVAKEDIESSPATNNPADDIYHSEAVHTGCVAPSAPPCVIVELSQAEPKTALTVKTLPPPDSPSKTSSENTEKANVSSVVPKACPSSAHEVGPGELKAPPIIKPVTRPLDPPLTFPIPPEQNGSPENVLFVQLTHDKIGLAVAEFENGKYILQAVQQEVFVPFEVAVTSNNDWCYGLGIKGNSSDPTSSLYQRKWKISSYFALPFSSRREATPPKDCFRVDNHNDQLITPKFLLATLFSLVRVELEKQQNISVGKVFVAVPFWYTSYAREQIMNAAKIAGFGIENTNVINENACLAFLAFQKDEHGKEFDAVVVSENSGIVDTSVFTFDEERKKLQILGYCGMYQLPRNSEAGNNPFFVPTLIPDVRKFVRNEEDVLQQHLQNALHQAELASGDGRPGKHFQRLMSFTTEKSTLAFDGMRSLQEYLRKNTRVTVENLLGIASPHQVAVVREDGKFILGKAFQMTGRQLYTFKWAFAAGRYNFYQVPEISGERFLFGRLTMRGEGEANDTMQITLEMTPDGVIFLQKVFNIKDRLLLDGSLYTWEGCRLKDKHRCEGEQLLTKVNPRDSLLGERHGEDDSTRKEEMVTFIWV